MTVRLFIALAIQCRIWNQFCYVLLGVFVTCQRTHISEDLLHWFVSYSSCNKLDGASRHVILQIAKKHLNVGT